MMIKSIRLAAGAVLAVIVGTGAFAHDTAQEAANKKLVLDFYAALRGPDVAATAERYIAPGYIQHLEGAENGRAAFVQYIIRARTPSAEAPRPAAGPPKLVAIMAEGDKVIQVTSRDVADPATGGTKPAIIWNMFRIENGQLAEHWDAIPTTIRPAGAK